MMPWLSRPSSPTASPKLEDVGAPKDDGVSRMSLSFTLPLRDKALGTTPLTHQRPAIHLLKHDLRHVSTAVPQVVSAFTSSLLQQQKCLSWGETRELLIYILVSAIEAQLLISILPLWLLTPGVFFLPWVCLQGVLIWLVLRRLNGTEQILTSATHVADGEESDVDGNFFWIVVGGIDISHARMRRSTLPNLANLLGQDMHTILPYRLGLPFEIISLYLRRNLQIPTSTSTTLYDLVRTNLLKPHVDGVRVLAHNTGALDTAWVLSQLCADLPSHVLSEKLQVFTFGATGVDMTASLGTLAPRDDLEKSQGQRLAYPAVTHFAFESDPFASIGVLPGIRQRLEGRYIGGLYSIGSGGIGTSRRRWTLDEYIDALFPGGDPRAGVLGQECTIDRKTSEIREMVALEQSINGVQLRMRKGRKKRLSWTALGAVASKTPDGGGSSRGSDDMAGAFALEEVRQRGIAIQGIRGYQNNALAAAVRGPHRLSPEEGVL